MVKKRLISILFPWNHNIHYSVKAYQEASTYRVENRKASSSTYLLIVEAEMSKK